MSLVHVLRLVRPENVLLTFISVWLAAFISPQFIAGIPVFLAACSASMILAGANIINDIYDLEIDRQNRPERVLVTGQVSVRAAWLLFFMSYGIGIVCSAFIGLEFLLIAAAIALLLVWYSTSLKRTVLWGNLIVSLAGGITFIYGALAVNDWQAGIIPAGFAFCYHFGREIVKDIQDLPGDLKNDAITFPGKYGIKPAVALINLIFGVLLILTVLPYIFSIYSETYLWFVLFGVDTVLIFVMAVLWFRQDSKTLSVLSTLLKVDMFAGLAAVWIGSRNVVFFN